MVTMTSFYYAFREDIEPAMGGWIDSLTAVKNKIGKMTSRSDGMIGIASNGVDGAHLRLNAKYKGLGMRFVSPLPLRTRHDHFRKEFEGSHGFLRQPVEK
jgi:hypothetical protein